MRLWCVHRRMYELAFCTELIKPAVFLSTIVASYIVYFYCFVCGVCVYVRVADRLVGVGCHLGLPSTLFFKTGFLSESAGLAGQQAPGISCLCLFSVELHSHGATPNSGPHPEVASTG